MKKSKSNPHQDSNNSGKSSRIQTITEIVRRRNAERRKNEFEFTFEKLCKEWQVE